MSFIAFKYYAENNKKIAFRIIEKLQNEIIKLKSHLQFNETCIINKLLPTYTNIYIYIYIYIQRWVVARYILGNVAVAPATYLSSDTRFCRYSATATSINKAFRFYLIVLNIIFKNSMIHT